MASARAPASPKAHAANRPDLEDASPQSHDVVFHSDTSQPPLLRLPVELRLVISECFFESICTALKHPFDSLPRRQRLTQLRDLFMTCRQIYEEAHPLYLKNWLSKTTFYFDNIADVHELELESKQRPLLAGTRFCVRSIDKGYHPQSIEGCLLQMIPSQPGYQNPYLPFLGELPHMWGPPGHHHWAWLLARQESDLDDFLRRTFWPAEQTEPAELIDDCKCGGRQKNCAQSRYLAAQLQGSCRLTL